MDKETEQDAERMLDHLKALASQWKSRLADPVLAKEIEAGRMAVSPLVRELLAMFPPTST